MNLKKESKSNLQIINSMEHEFLNNFIGVLNGNQPKLQWLEVYITNNCNLHCIACESLGKRYYEPHNELSDEEFISIIKDAISLGVKKISIFGGGEALTRPRLIEKLITLIKKNNVYSSLQTNGTLFTEEIIRKAVEYNFDEISISIDGPDAKTHDFLRGKKGSFDLIIKNLKRFSYWKNKYDSFFPKIIITPVLTSKNFDKLDKMVLLAKEHGIFDIKLGVLHSINEPKKNYLDLKIKKHEIRKLQSNILKAIDIANKNNISNNFEFVQNLISTQNNNDEKKDEKNLNQHLQSDNLLKSKCLMPWYYLGLLPNGEIRVCPIEREPKRFDFTENSLKKIWNNTYYKNIRLNFINGQMKKTCKNCHAGYLWEMDSYKNKIRQMIE